MTPDQRTEALFTTAKQLGLIGFNGDATPTFNMVREAITEAENDTAPEADELATYVKRLARRLRKHEKDSPLADSAIEFVKCTGHAKPLREDTK